MWMPLHGVSPQALCSSTYYNLACADVNCWWQILSKQCSKLKCGNTNTEEHVSCHDPWTIKFKELLNGKNVFFFCRHLIKVISQYYYHDSKYCCLKLNCSVPEETFPVSSRLQKMMLHNTNKILQKGSLLLELEALVYLWSMTPMQRYDDPFLFVFKMLWQ